MAEKLVMKLLSVFFVVAVAFSTTIAADQGNQTDSADSKVDAVLKQLQEKTSRLTSYEGGIIYRYRQPLLDSESLRRGVIYYAKFGPAYGNRGFLRINFQTLKQDEEKEQKYREEYIFDGVWLTQLNFQIKSAKKHQLAEEDKPADAFDLASDNLPVIGFTRIWELKQEFEIQVVPERAPASPNLVKLHLKTRPQSRYKDQYRSIDFWVDRNLGLPAKVVALSTEEEVYEIELVKPKINKGIDKKVFEYEIPKDFGKPEIMPLDPKSQSK